MRSEPSSMSVRHLIAVVVCAIVLGGVSAVTAKAATVGPQRSATAPETFPASLPGGFRAGDVIPVHDVLLSRAVAMAIDESWHTLTFTCPSHTRALSPGLQDASELTIGVSAEQYRRPRRRFRFRVRPAPSRLVSGDQASGIAFLVCGPRPLR